MKIASALLVAGALLQCGVAAAISASRPLGDVGPGRQSKYDPMVGVVWCSHGTWFGEVIVSHKRIMPDKHPPMKMPFYDGIETFYENELPSLPHGTLSRSLADYFSRRQKLWVIRETRVGAPAPSLYWRFVGDLDDNYAIENGFVVDNVPVDAHMHMHAAVPLGVLWTGTVINSTAFGTALGAIALSIRLLRRRFRRGRCAQCGYSRAGLAFAAPCPECGAQASPGRQARDANEGVPK